MEYDAFLRFLGLVRKAGKLSCGEEKSIRARKLGKAHLILLAKDASGNASDRAAALSDERSCPLMKLPYTKDQLADASGTAPFAIAAVCDPGFARALREKLPQPGSGAIP